MDGGGCRGEWELRGHKTSATNNSSTDVVVTAKEMMKVFPGCHTITLVFHQQP